MGPEERRGPLRGHEAVVLDQRDVGRRGSGDPGRTQLRNRLGLVEALAALEPANVNVAKFVERGCILLLNQARRSLAEGDKRDATALARRAAAAKLTGQAIRIRCADVLADCGRPDEGAVVLLDSHEYDDKLLGRVAALLRSVDDWSGLYVRFESLRQLPECEEILVDVRNRISVQLNESLDSKDVLHLLDGALALVAASRPFAIDSDLAAAILKRSRRAIRQLGRGNHPLVGELCSKHLALCPEDRDVRRRYVRLLMACGRHSEARDELLHQMRRDPHDEAMWRDLSKCCAILGLRREASDAETRAHSMADSGTFDVVELRS